MPHQEIVHRVGSIALVAHTAQQPRVGILEVATFRVLNLGPAHAVITGWGWLLSAEIPPAPKQIRSHVVPMWEVVPPGRESEELPFRDKDRWLRHLNRWAHGDKATLGHPIRPRNVLVRVRTADADEEIDLSCDVDVEYTSDNPLIASTRLLRK